MESRRITKECSRGFSLVEILIVLIIIGIAGSISISGLGSAIKSNERNEEKNFVQFLNSSINHVYKSGETIKIVFTPNSAITLNNNHEIDKFNFKKITVEQTTSDMKSFTNEFQIHINQKILTDSLQIIIKENSNRKKLVLGINGVQIQQK